MTDEKLMSFIFADESNRRRNQWQHKPQHSTRFDSADVRFIIYVLAQNYLR